MEQEKLQKMAELYTETENDIPPTEMVTAHEQSYNNGFYQGRLKALEEVCQKVFGVDGDSLLDN